MRIDEYMQAFWTHYQGFAFFQLQLSKALVCHDGFYHFLIIGTL